MKKDLVGKILNYVWINLKADAYLQWLPTESWLLLSLGQMQVTPGSWGKERVED